jgi:hypothetical protein
VRPTRFAKAILGQALVRGGLWKRRLRTSRVQAEAANEELVRSKAEIEHRVGREVQHFAFPNEASSGALVTAAAAAGYRTTCLAEPVAQRGALGIRPLRRLGMHEGVCGDGRSFNEGLLRYWLFRAPVGVPA